MQETFGDDIRVIGVASRDDVDAIRGFVDSYQVQGFEHIIDEGGVIWERYGVFSQPAFAFINDDGTVETNIGAMGLEGLTEAAQALKAT